MDDIRPALILVGLILMAMVAATTCNTARGDDPLEVQLARYAVHEAGFDAPGDAVAIWEVARWRAEHIPGLARCNGDLVCVLRAYAAERPFREPWIAELGAGKPTSWPTDVSWERRYARRWQRTVEMARAWLRGALPAPCRYQPMHWGSRNITIDVVRAERAVQAGRWRRAQCFDPVRRRPTLNAFYCITGRCRSLDPRAPRNPATVPTM